MKEFASNVLEFIFIVIGLQLLHTSYTVYKDKTNPARLGTTLFWGLLGVVFIGGKAIPPVLTGVIVFVIALLTLFKQVRIGTLPVVNEKQAEKSANELKSLIFLPVIVLAFVAFLVPMLFKELGSSAIGIAAFVATITVLVVTKQKPKALLQENTRMVQQVSTSSILPQLLAALGVVFTKTDVGTVISGVISNAVPENNRFFGVVAYVLGMVIFTIIMGNAFAAFTVITTGIGVPFVIALGANPIVAGALAMTAGYCGTLLTPMAANFNAVPVALMDIEDKNSVIKAQAPVAFILIIAHIVLMYFLAF